MESERKFWVFLIVTIGISAFLAGGYWNMLRTNTALIESLEMQMGLLQDENDFLLEHDLQISEELVDLRNILKDLEDWMEESQEEQDMELGDYIERFERINDRFTSAQNQIYSMRNTIRELKRLHCNCTCNDDIDGYYGGPWCDWCECYCWNCTGPYCTP